MPRPLRSIPTGCSRPIRRRATIARALYARGRGPADRQPARPYRSGLVRDRRALDQRRPSCCSRPTIISSGCSTARACARRARRAEPRRAVRAPIRARRGGCSPAHYHLFRGTPSRLWLDHVFAEVFGIDVALEAATADLYYDRIGEALATPAFRPRALFDRFDIELLATTEGAHEDLRPSRRDPRLGLAGPGRHHLPARRGDRSRA